MARNEEGRVRPLGMIERLACCCENCERELTDERRALRFERGGCVRHAYECACGAVTVTVARE